MHARRRSALLFSAFLLAGILIGALLVWMSTGAGERGHGVARGVLDTPDESFSLTGDLSQVFTPGVFVPLDLSITNSKDVALVVTELVVEVTGVSAPNATKLLPCTVKDFTVNQVDKKFALTVEPGATIALSKLGLPSTAWPQVGMPVDKKTNQDGCKGATLALSFSGVGEVEQ